MKRARLTDSTTRVYHARVPDGRSRHVDEIRGDQDDKEEYEMRGLAKSKGGRIHFQYRRTGRTTKTRPSIDWRLYIFTKFATACFHGHAGSNNPAGVILSAIHLDGLHYITAKPRNSAQLRNNDIDRLSERTVGHQGGLT